MHEARLSRILRGETIPTTREVSNIVAVTSGVISYEDLLPKPDEDVRPFG